MKEYNFSIDKKEVERYLGIKKEVDENTNKLIDECIEEINKIARVRYTYKIFNIEKRHNKIMFGECNFILEGKSILNHLKHSDKCVLLAVTLGSEVDRKINYYEKINMTKSLILDACATTAIEDACDFVQEEIRDIAKSESKNITYRFSPGYGDLSLNIQEQFIKILETQKNIGLTASEYNILIPRKSVTAVVGFIPKEVECEKPSCYTCNKYSNCKFKRGGERCAH